MFKPFYKLHLDQICFIRTIKSLLETFDGPSDIVGLGIKTMGKAQCPLSWSLQTGWDKCVGDFRTSHAVAFLLHTGPVHGVPGEAAGSMMAQQGLCRSRSVL